VLLILSGFLSAIDCALFYSGIAETWWDAGGIFACPDTDSFSARCQNWEGHSPLAIHTAEFLHVLVLLAASFALCFGESINLT
jgi:hypothetical protein